MVDLAATARRLAGRARPGEQVEAFVARSRRVTVRAHDGGVESFTSAESAGVGVRVVAAGRQGFAHAGTLDGAVIDEVLADARTNAELGEPDPWYGLAEPDGVAPPVLDLFRPGLTRFPTDAKVELALSLERAVRADPRVRGVRQATYADGVGEVAIASSTGIDVWSEATSCWLSVTALAPDGERTQVGGGVSVGREPADLDLDHAAGEAIERATRLLGAQPVTSRRGPVVLERRVAAAVAGIVGGMLSGELVLKGRSPFAGRVGEAIASPLVSLVDDATDPRSLGADTTDAEGLATRRTVLVERGVLQRFLHNTYTGRRSGEGTTASAVRGYASTPGVGPQVLGLAPGSGSVEDLCRHIGDGLLVLSVSGLHSGVNPVSGDLSVGAEGLLVEGGVPTCPVREVTVATTLPRLLLDVVAVGDDVEWLPGGTPAVSIAVADVQLSGR